MEGGIADDHLFAGGRNDIVLAGGDNLDVGLYQDYLIADIGADTSQPYLFRRF